MRLLVSLGDEVYTCCVCPHSLHNHPACFHAAPHHTESPQAPEEAQAGPGAEQGFLVTLSAGRAKQAQAEHMLGSPSSKGIKLGLPFLLGPQL